MKKLSKQDIKDISKQITIDGLIQSSLMTYTAEADKIAREYAKAHMDFAANQTNSKLLEKQFNHFLEINKYDIVRKASKDLLKSFDKEELKTLLQNVLTTIIEDKFDVQ